MTNIKHPIGTLLIINGLGSPCAYTGIVIAHESDRGYRVKWTHTNDEVVYRQQDIDSFLTSMR